MLKNLIMAFSRVTVILLLITVPGFIRAQEIYFLGGYQGGGEFTSDSGESFELDEDNSLGLVLTIELEQDRDFEFTWSRQSTSLINKSADPNAALFDIDIDYIHLGGTALINDRDGWRTFVLGGVGLVHFSPEDNYDSETRLSLSLGLGLKKHIGKHLLLRTDARLYGTFFDSGSSIFCVNSNCTLTVDGGFETQYQLNVGLGYQF